jgi:hypothetical protein
LTVGGYITQPIRRGAQLNVVAVGQRVTHDTGGLHPYLGQSSQTAQLVAHHFGFVAQLGGIGYVLPLAPAAGRRTEMGATRLNPIGGWLNHFNQVGSGPTPLLSFDLCQDSFTRDCIWDKDDLTLVMPEGETAVSHTGQSELNRVFSYEHITRC